MIRRLKYHHLVNEYIKWEESPVTPIREELARQKNYWDFAHKLTMCIGMKQNRILGMREAFPGLDLPAINLAFKCAEQYYAESVLPSRRYLIAQGIEYAKQGIELSLLRRVNDETGEEIVTVKDAKLYDASLKNFYRFTTLRQEEDDILPPELFQPRVNKLGRWEELLPEAQMSADETDKFINQVLTKVRKKQNDEYSEFEPAEKQIADE